MTRQWEIDALRGWMLVMMTITHLPTRLTEPLGQPLGFVSSAEGFVLLSAYMAGGIYSRRAYREGIVTMRRAFLRRALKVYLGQAATLLFLFTVITAIGLHVDQPAVKNLLSYYLQHPHTALVAGLLLVYEPPLLDILPIYILFMLLSPAVLAFALRHGWRGVLAASLLLWVLSQFGLSQALYGAAVAVTGLGVPFRETGAFHTFAWQLLWVGGLWLGAREQAPGAWPLRFPRWLLAAACAVALGGLVWRHLGAYGQMPFGPGATVLNRLFDKWELGPLRLLDLLALVVLTIRYGARLAHWLPRQRWIEALGAASLPVFCAHLVAVLMVLALYGGSRLARPWWGDLALLALVFAGLYGVARLALALPRRSKTAVATPGRTAGAAPLAPVAPADGRPSGPRTADSRAAITDCHKR